MGYIPYHPVAHLHDLWKQLTLLVFSHRVDDKEAMSKNSVL